MVADEKVEQLLERITALENRVDELEQEKTNLYVFTPRTISPLSRKLLLTQQ